MLLGDDRIDHGPNMGLAATLASLATMAIVPPSAALLPPTRTADRPLGVGAALLTVLATFVGGQVSGAATAVFVALAIVVARGGSAAQTLRNADELTSDPLFVSIAALTAGLTLVLAAWLALRIVRVPFRAGTALRGARAAHIALALLLVLAAGPFADLAIQAFRAAFPGLTLGLLESIGEAAQTSGPRLLVLLVCVSLVPGIAEEIFFRGLVQRSLTARLGAPLGIGLASVLFGAFHVDPPQAIGAAVLGLALGFVVWRTGSVVPAVVAHAANNALALAVARQPVEPAAGDGPAQVWVLGVSGAIAALAVAALVRTTPRQTT